MADIIDFASHKKKQPEKPTIMSLANEGIEEILSHWEKFAANNRLNEYFIQSTPSWSKTNINYLEDLTELSIIEKKIHLEPQIVAPGFAVDNPLGWIAGFRMGGEVIATSFMPSEQYARCFNILLFIKLKRELIQHGINL